MGIVPEPNEDWMKQIARKLTDCLGGFLNGYRYLIHDRAPQFSKSFRMILRSGGVKTIRLPRRSPNLNSFAERWVRTAKELCVDRGNRLLGPYPISAISFSDPVTILFIGTQSRGRITDWNSVRAFFQGNERLLVK